MTPLDDRPASGARRAAVVLALIVVIDSLALSEVGDDLGLLRWWSGVGLGAVLLARSPVRWWAGLAALVVALPLLSAVALGHDLTDTALVGGSHGAQALVAAAILTGLGRHRAGVETPLALALLVLAAAGSGLVAAAVETSVRTEPVTSATLVLETGGLHALSVLVLGAVLLSPRPSWQPPDASWRHVPPLLLLQSVAAAAVAAAVFVPPMSAPVTFVLIPVLVWGALVYEVRVAALQLLATTVAVLLATASGRGPFASGEVAPALVELVALGYLASIALVTLPLAVIVTQRRLLTRRVASDERLFRRTFTESPLGMAILRTAPEGLVVDEANDAAGRILEMSVDDVSGRLFDELVGVVDHRTGSFQSLLSSPVDSWRGEATVLGRPGSRLDVALAAVSDVGSPVYSVQLLDRSQEHDSRRRLEQAHQLTDATLETAACIILVADHTGRIVRVNAAAKELTGCDEAALVGQLLWESPIPALGRAETEAMFVWPNRSGRSIAREQLAHSADGTPRRLVWNSNVVWDETGAPSYAVLTGVDVTTERSSTGLMSHLLQASIATAIIGIGVSGRITVVNAGAAHMLGATAEELVGRPFVSILDPTQLNARTGAAGEREAFLCLVGMIGYADESIASDWTWRTARGHELTVSMTLSVTDADVEDRIGFLCVGRDVTEQREGQETLLAALDRERTAVDRLRALDRAKDEFVSTVSHELRTPVTSILGYAELLLDGEVVEPHPQQSGMLQTIARNGHRLVAICNDLLLLSGFESPEVLGTRERYDLREAVGAAEEFTRAACAQRSLTVTFSCPDQAVMVSGDRSQLDRVLVNLVSNAVKFTDDSGTVEVSLSLDPTVGAVVRVSDTGIGIHPDDQEQVFQRFYRTVDAQVRAIPGTGLGLSIVAGIVEAHGGDVALDSVPGSGTTVTVRLPVVASPVPVEPGSTDLSGSQPPG